MVEFRRALAMREAALEENFLFLSACLITARREGGGDLGLGVAKPLLDRTVFFEKEDLVFWVETVGGRTEETEVC